MLLAGTSATSAGDFLPHGLGIGNPFDSCTHKSSFVLLAGIEPASPPSEGGILSIERQELRRTIGPPGIEPGLHAPHACVLPVYYGPFFRSRKIFGRGAGNRTQLYRFAPGQSPGLSAPCSVSGRRESNSVFTHPKRTYYRYTTPRHRTLGPKAHYYDTTSKRVREIETRFYFRTSAGRKLRSNIHPEQRPRAAQCGWTIPDSLPTAAGGLRSRGLDNANPFESGTQRSSSLLWPPQNAGGPYRIRTGHLCNANAALYQMS